MNFNAAVMFLAMMIPAIVASPGLHRDVSTRPVGMFFLLIGVLGFLLPYGLAPSLLFLYGLMVIVIAKDKGVPVFFAAFLFSLPATVSWQLPFPGINYLIELSPLVILSFLLFPLSMKDRGIIYGGFSYILVICVLWFWILDLRWYEQTITNAMRQLFTSLITICVSVFTIIGAISARDRFLEFLIYSATAFIILTYLGMWSWILSWYFYSALPLFDVSFYYALFREGGMRWNSTVNSVLMPLLMTIATMLTFFFKSKWRGKLLLVWIALLPMVFLLGGSRGGLLAGLVTLASYFGFRWTNPATRRVGYVAATGLAIIVFPILLNFDFSSIDPYGTFEYRERLLRVSTEVILQKPVFGDANYESNPIFEQIRQGQGIIDFVNTYIQVALRYGLVGLGLFLAIFLLPMRLALKAANEVAEDAFGADYNAKSLGYGIAAAIIGHMVMIMTVSEVSHIAYFKYLLAVTGVAYYNVAMKTVQPAKAPSLTN